MDKKIELYEAAEQYVQVGVQNVWHGSCKVTVEMDNLH